jgi:hypothetical protein
MKQRTYLITLPDHPPHQRNSKKTKRNLFCATPLRPRGLSSLTSLSSHIFYRQHNPGNPGEFLNSDDLGGQTTRNVKGNEVNTVTAYLLQQIQLLAHRDRGGLAPRWNYGDRIPFARDLRRNGD